MVKPNAKKKVTSLEKKKVIKLTSNETTDNNAGKKNKKKSIGMEEQQHLEGHAEVSTIDSAEEPPSAELDRAIVACVTRRIRSTVRIRPLPSGCRLADLQALCPAAVAVRLPWNRARRRHKGVAFLEFAGPGAAAKHAKALQGSKALGGGRELTTSIRAESDAAAAVSAAAYSRHRVVVSSLEGRVTARQLMSLAPDAQSVRFPALHAASAGKRAPGVAVLTFARAQQALEAVANCQGAVLAGCKTSWMLEKLTKEGKPQDQVDNRTLVLTGITKAMPESRLLLWLPRCSRLLHRGSGTAVARYPSEAAAAADVAEWPGGPDLPRLTFGHRRAGASDTDVGVEKARAPSTPQLMKTRLVAAGLPAGTKKAQLQVFLASPDRVGGDDDDAVANGGLRRITLSSDGRLAVLSFVSEAAAAAARLRFRRRAFAEGSGSRVRTAFSLGQLAAATAKAAAARKKLASQSAKSKLSAGRSASAKKRHA